LSLPPPPRSPLSPYTTLFRSSVLLAGVLLKMGGYGMIRMAVSIFPNVAHRYGLLLAVLAAINVLYGALLVLRQTDLKRLVAYSSDRKSTRLNSSHSQISYAVF